MCHDCDSGVLFAVIFQHSELFVVIREYPNLQGLFKCDVTPSLSPAFLHYLQTAFNCFLAPFLSLQAFQLGQSPFTIFFIVKGVNVPGFLVGYVIEVEGGEELHGLLDFGANVVGGFHDLAEGRLDDDGSFGVMCFEDDGAGGECPPHGGDDDKVDINLLHFFFRLEGMQSSFLSDIDIEIFPVKLLLDVLLSIIEIFLSIFLFHLVGNSIELGLSMTNEIQHLDWFGIITASCSIGVSQTRRTTQNRSQN